MPDQISHQIFKRISVILFFLPGVLQWSHLTSFCHFHCTGWVDWPHLSSPVSEPKLRHAVSQVLSYVRTPHVIAKDKRKCDWIIFKSITNHSPSLLHFYWKKLQIIKIYLQNWLQVGRISGVHSSNYLEFSGSLHDTTPTTHCQTPQNHY